MYAPVLAYKSTLILVYKRILIVGNKHYFILGKKNDIIVAYKHTVVLGKKCIRYIAIFVSPLSPMLRCALLTMRILAPAPLCLEK